jgi:hypothetical protein
MPRRTTKRTRRKRWRIARFLPSARTRKRWWRAFRRAPGGAQVAITFTVALSLWLAINFTYQVVRKPSELFFPVSGTLYKSPAETWAQYSSIFNKHATGVITPDLLAALAQVEGSGNPVVRTYWRWSFTKKPFEVYRPASSAVGMYQITDGTFAVARHYCIHDHRVVEDGPWDAPRSCWFNSLYTRVIPSHAVELTAAYLDRNVANILARYRAPATLSQKQNLAAVIHLCGAGEAAHFASRGFRLVTGQHCGDHDVQGYLERVAAMKRVFARYAAAMN